MSTLRQSYTLNYQGNFTHAAQKRCNASQKIEVWADGKTLLLENSLYIH